MAHVVGFLTANAGRKPLIYSKQQIIALYSAIGGYKPGVPSTVQGCDEQTALNFWENDGAPIGTTHKIAGWLSIDGANPEEYRTALWLLENLYFSLELPNAWATPTPSISGFIWDAAGHPHICTNHQGAEHVLVVTRSGKWTLCLGTLDNKNGPSARHCPGNGLSTRGLREPRQ